MTNDELFVSVALSAWKTTLERADKVFSDLTQEQAEKEVAPGKNRLIYLWGHLTAVHDRMLPLLGFGQRLYPELDDLFISKPDSTATPLPAANELRQCWKAVNSKLMESFEKLPASDWLQRHEAVSEEDFAKDPSRNRFAVLLSRTNHLSSHLGQVALSRE
jgi:hypothetical protein